MMIEGDRNTGQEVVASAHTRLMSEERRYRALFAFGRLATAAGACSAWENYAHRGDEPKALTALGLLAVIEASRAALARRQRRDYDRVVANEINQVIGETGNDA